MWLLDVNIDLAVKGFLVKQGIACRTSQEHGWQGLANGALVQASNQAGFRVLLTRDRLLQESAAATLKRYPEFALVLLTMHQAPSKKYMAGFVAQWQRAPIKPVPGQLVIWP